MKITFVLLHAYGMGGTIRTVISLANNLAPKHDVEIISVVRKRQKPFFAIEPRVRVRPGADFLRLGRPAGGLRRQVARWAAEQPSRFVHRGDKMYESNTLWSDIQLLRILRNIETDVLVTTRPGLSIFAARFANDRVVRVAQEHSFVTSYDETLKAEMRRRYKDLDAVVSLTPFHDSDLGEVLDGVPVRRAVIPNGIRTVGLPRSTHENKLVMAAGRLAHVKRYDHLIRAFAMVAKEHPDWRLRIYGGGGRERSLRRLIQELGLYNHVFLMGQSSSMGREFAKASITAMSSVSEGLPMALLEAMACGVPPVSYDCPVGPRSVISDGVDGLLVENGDIEALGQGIISLIDDPERRRAMGRAALEKVARYDEHAVAEQWEALFQELVDQKRRSRS